jgi:hypothetical protein
MNKPAARLLRCAIYTRVSTEHGLDQDFNSLEAQREAAEAYVKSQAHEGWRLLKERFDDGGVSGGRSTGRRCSASWPRSVQGRSTSWSSTRSTA